MELQQTLDNRRAYRAISNDPIEKETLEQLALAARLAPSAGNSQPWRIITVSNPEILHSMHGVLSRGNYWASKAAAITAFITKKEWSIQLGERPFAYFELGMAAMAYQLKATEEHLVAHPIAGFNDEKAKALLNIGSTEQVFVLIILGHKIEDDSFLHDKHRQAEHEQRTRKPLNEIFAFDSWNEKLNPQ
ncbi:MAG: nitroreductase family protein [Sphaerochaetaceae bacterium]